MLDIIKAIILGIVEGATEFLPISSTGHLILVNQFVSFGEGFTNKFDVIIQLGAIIAVVIYFRKTLFPLKEEYSHFFKSRTFDLWKKTIVGVIPALIIGALFHDKIEDFLFNPFTVAVALIIGGVILIAVEMNKNRTVKIDSIEKLTYSVPCYDSWYFKIRCNYRGGFASWLLKGCGSRVFFLPGYSDHRGGNSLLEMMLSDSCI